MEKNSLQSDHYLILIALSLSSAPINKKEISDLVNNYIRSYQTVSKKLDFLDEMGLITSTKIGRDIVYKILEKGAEELQRWEKSETGVQFGLEWKKKIQSKIKR